MSTQKDAVRVLATLVAVDGLPSMTWHVPPYDGGGLEAQPFVVGGSDDDERAVMQAWAGHLGVPVVNQARDCYVEVTVSAEIDGVPIRIYTHAARTYTYVQVPIEQAVTA